MKVKLNRRNIKILFEQGIGPDTKVTFILSCNGRTGERKSKLIRRNDFQHVGPGDRIKTSFDVMIAIGSF